MWLVQFNLKKEGGTGLGYQRKTTKTTDLNPKRKSALRSTDLFRKIVALDL